MTRTTAKAGSLGVVILSLWGAGCGSPDDPANLVHATFSVDGVAQDYKTNTSFWQPLYSVAYCASGNPSNCSHSLTVDLPSDVKTGDVFTQPSAPFSFILYQDAQGVQYRPEDCSGPGMTLTVTSWPGPGHYAQGTFAGTVYDESCTHSVVLANGTFEGWIVN